MDERISLFIHLRKTTTAKAISQDMGLDIESIDEIVCSLIREGKAIRRKVIQATGNVMYSVDVAMLRQAILPNPTSEGGDLQALTA
jgi:dephospho-CoA kinase